MSPVNVRAPEDGRGRLLLKRSHSYALLGRLFLHGLAGENLHGARNIPILSNALPVAFDSDEAAADHQHLFGFNVFPYQSIFLNPSGLLGGPVTESVILSYQDSGYLVDDSSESPDHFGYELDFLSYLCREEAEAHQAGLHDVAQRVLGRQRNFLARHLLCWLPALVLAIDQQNHPFYKALVALTLDTVRAHHGYLGGSAGENYTLLGPPALLADESTGLREIVAFLLTPVYSGIYLSRDDIGRLAQPKAIPHGFGDRDQMLLNTLLSAANYGVLDDILSSLQKFVSAWIDSFHKMAALPEPIPTAAAWEQQAAGTAAMLSQVQDRSSSVASR